MLDRGVRGRDGVSSGTGASIGTMLGRRAWTGTASASITVSPTQRNALSASVTAWTFSAWVSLANGTGTTLTFGTALTRSNSYEYPHKYPT